MSWPEMTVPGDRKPKVGCDGGRESSGRVCMRLRVVLMMENDVIEERKNESYEVYLYVSSCDRKNPK